MPSNAQASKRSALSQAAWRVLESASATPEASEVAMEEQPKAQTSDVTQPKAHETSQAVKYVCSRDTRGSRLPEGELSTLSHCLTFEPSTELLAELICARICRTFLATFTPPWSTASCFRPSFCNIPLPRPWLTS